MHGYITDSVIYSISGKWSRSKATELVLAGSMNHWAVIKTHDKPGSKFSETLRRHGGSGWNVHFSVQKAKKEEGGVLIQLSYFFQWNIPRHRNSLSSFVPPFLCPCFLSIKSLLHFQQMTRWGYWTTLLVIEAKWVWGNGSYSLCWSVYWSTRGLITFPCHWKRKKEYKIKLQTSKLWLEESNVRW